VTDAAGPARPGRGATYGAAAAGGALYFLGYLGWGVWPCLLVFLAPLWWALERTGGAPVAATLVAGLVFGLVAYAGGFAWLWWLVDAFLEHDRLVGAVLWLAYGLWFAAGFVAYAAVFRAIRARGWPIALAGVPTLVVLEWLQPTLFPVNAGSALVDVTPVVQAAALGGPLLLTALLGIANLAAYRSWTWWREGASTPLGAWAAAALAALATLAYGAVHLDAIARASRDAPALRVGIVQPNLGLVEKRTQGVLAHRAHLEQTRELLAGGDVDLVVWPETAYVRGLRGPLPVSGRPIAEDLAVPLLFGGSGVREENGRRLATNTAFLVGADGTIRDAYEKNLLIPLAEYAPLGGVVPGLARWFPHASEFGAASDMPPLRLGPWRIATPICYEVVRPEFVRRMMRAARPHLLVTLANDAWFGHSQEPWIHLALARLRAVEHGRWLVRATNSGISAIIDPAGRVRERSALFTRESLRGVVHPLDAETPYTRWGDWVGWGAALLVATGLAARRGPRSPATDVAQSGD